MSPQDEQSFEEPMGAEAFEQGDEAMDEEARLAKDFIDEIEQDPSLDPALLVDDRELEEIGANLDDPEVLVTLDGGIDDPDGLGGPRAQGGATGESERGWDLDAPLANEGSADDDEIAGSTD
jgi:hypothetical protein